MEGVKELKRLKDEIEKAGLDGFEDAITEYIRDCRDNPGKLEVARILGEFASMGPLQLGHALLFIGLYDS